MTACKSNYLKGIFLSFQEIIKVLKLDPQNSSYGSWKSPQTIGELLHFGALIVTFATVDFVYNCKQATPLTWAVIIIEGVLVVSVHT